MTIVVPVLITSCHVSLKPNSGPVAAPTTMTPTASVNTGGLPQKCDALREPRVPRGVVHRVIPLVDGFGPVGDQEPWNAMGSLPQCAPRADASDHTASSLPLGSRK